MEADEMHDVTSLNDRMDHQFFNSIQSMVEIVKSKLLDKLETSKELIEGHDTAANVMDAFAMIIEHRMNELTTDIRSHCRMIGDGSPRAESAEKKCKILEQEVFALKAEREAIKVQMKEIQMETEEKFKSIFCNLVKLRNEFESKEEMVNVQHDQPESTSLNECDVVPALERVENGTGSTEQEMESEEYDVVPERVDNGTGSTEQEIESEEDNYSSSELEIDAIESDDNCSDSDYNPDFDCGFVSEISAASNDEKVNGHDQSRTSITPTVHDQSNTVDDEGSISISNDSPSDLSDVTGSIGNGSGNEYRNIGRRARSSRTRGRRSNVDQHRRYQCPQCSYSATQKSHLTKHIRIHTGEKPFECRVCHKRFIQKGALKVHERIHSGEKPYQCVYCGEAFTRKDTMTNHVRRRHTGERPYECTYPMCDRRFVTKSDMSQHRRTHTGERPFQCTYCAKAFTQRCNLNVHIRRHTGDKPYECTHSMCGRRFVTKIELTKHQRTHTGEKPYQCTFCWKRFSDKSNMNSHLKNNHRNH